MTMASSGAPDADHQAVVDAVLGLSSTAEQLGRDDLASRLRIAVARLTRPTTVICVVGEFKQGKSSLVNALIGEAVCPVDDDLATSALTLLRHGEERRAEVRRRVEDRVVVEVTDVAALSDWVSEASNPGNEKGVERVDVYVPNDVLAHGIAIVDTPGMGSLGAGHAAATLAFLPFADALVFATDATSELSAPEVEFLHRAMELCPNVLVALTKTDLYPSWRRVADLDAAHLARTSGDLRPIPVSSHLRNVAISRRDRDLNEQSGFPALFAALETQAIRPARDLAARRALDEAAAVGAQLRTGLEAELEVLTDPSRSGEAAARAQAMAARLDHLRGPGSRWSQLVGDRITDLSNDVSFRFRGAMRAAARDLEARIEEMKTPKEWDELARQLQTVVADAVTSAFVAVAEAGDSIRDDVVVLLAEEAGGADGSGAQAVAFDVQALWSRKDLDPKASRSGRALNNAVTGMRGAQSGIVMFGMMARFLPAGVGAILMMNPVTVGLGVAFGGMQLLDAHKRRITQRRQAARVSVRQFVDDVQFEVGNAIAEAVRGVQRAIRDEFTERVAELQRTYADAGRQAAEAAKRSQSEAAQRRTEVEGALASVGTVMGQLAAAAAPA